MFGNTTSLVVPFYTNVNIFYMEAKFKSKSNINSKRKGHYILGSSTMTAVS